MGLDELDEAYRKEVEKADKTFVDAIKAKIHVKEAEKAYVQRLKSARERYNKQVARNLGSLRGKKKASKPKNVVTKPFAVDLERYNLTPIQKIRYRFGLFKFRFRIAFRNFRRSITPSAISYFYIVVKFKIYRTYKRNRERLSSTIDAVENFLAKSYENLKEVMKKLYEKAANLPEQIMNKLKNLRKKGGEKKEGEKEEKKEEEKKEN